MRKALLYAGIFFPVFITAQTVNINLGTTTVATTTLYTTNDLPWELKYGPGDSLWMTTKQGRVYRIHPTNGGATLLLDHSASVWQNNESGMLGMAFHPNFSVTPQVFIAYTYTSGGLNRERLSRFNYSGNSLLLPETVLIDGAAIAANTIHNGSRLLVLPDNTILMTTGDANNTANPQNSSALNGKILRVNFDGSIPANNPTPGSMVYTKGHRNPQGLALHPNGKIYETEHGPNNNDEFQIIEAGRNYGWPNVEGYCDNDINGNEITFCNANNIKAPLAAWNPLPGGTWAPNDLLWYAHPAIPEFQNSFLVTFLKQSKLRRITLNAAGDAITGQTDFFVNQWGRLRDITAAPNGDIYLATNTAPFRIIRIVNPSAAPVPVSLLSFQVSKQGKQVAVSWKTALEENVSHFEIERAVNPATFSKKGEVAARNLSTGSSYEYMDAAPANGINYYRLKIVDADGKFQYSAVEKISFNENPLVIKPNPASSNIYYTIELSNGPASISVVDIQGRVMLRETKLVTNGVLDNRLNIDKLGDGTYILRVRTNDKTYQSFFEKQ